MPAFADFEIDDMNFCIIFTQICGSHGPVYEAYYRQVISYCKIRLFELLLLKKLKLLILLKTHGTLGTLGLFQLFCYIPALLVTFLIICKIYNCTELSKKIFVSLW